MSEQRALAWDAFFGVRGSFARMGPLCRYYADKEARCGADWIWEGAFAGDGKYRTIRMFLKMNDVGMLLHLCCSSLAPALWHSVLVNPQVLILRPITAHEWLYMVLTITAQDFDRTFLLVSTQHRLGLKFYFL
jgi:hypothetical protein